MERKAQLLPAGACAMIDLAARSLPVRPNRHPQFAFVAASARGDRAGLRRPLQVVRQVYKDSYAHRQEEHDVQHVKDRHETLSWKKASGKEQTRPDENDPEGYAFFVGYEHQTRREKYWKPEQARLRGQALQIRGVHAAGVQIGSHFHSELDARESQRNGRNAAYMTVHAPEQAAKQTQNKQRRKRRDFLDINENEKEERRRQTPRNWTV
jgi:hypothetical protein